LFLQYNAEQNRSLYCKVSAAKSVCEESVSASHKIVILLGHCKMTFRKSFDERYVCDRRVGIGHNMPLLKSLPRLDIDTIKALLLRSMLPEFGPVKTWR
jgi:hypothetical protein